MINLHVTVNDETYKITELIADFVEAQHDMRLMSEELERNERTIAQLNSKIEELEERANAEYVLELEADMAYMRERIFELEEALGQIQDLASQTL